MVDRCCVVVTDGARARFLTLNERASPPSVARPFLVEQWDLINPEADLKGRDLWSDLKTGRGREAGAAQAHGYDDHRDAHEVEFKRRFAVRIVAKVLSMARAGRADRVILAAERRMLGFLRPPLADVLEDDVEIYEIAKDLTKLSAAELQDRLAAQDLLPGRRRRKRSTGGTTMPEKKTVERARRAKRQGKSPSTQAGEFVREEIHHVREGKHGARSPEQVIAIGLSKARRAGVKLGSAKKSAKKKTGKKTSAAGRAAASRTALSRHAKTAARRRGASARSRSAQKAARKRKRRHR
jgi:protein required for attachment to host cells